MRARLGPVAGVGGHLCDDRSFPTRRRLRLAVRPPGVNPQGVDAFEAAITFGTLEHCMSFRMKGSVCRVSLARSRERRLEGDEIREVGAAISQVVQCR